jgi:hypothetical protein
MQPYSPLYCRFNGFALGAFLGGSSLEFAAPRFGAMRRRVHEFLSEIGVEARLPSRHATYRAGYIGQFETIRGQVRARSELLHDLMGIGAMAVLYADSGALATRAQKRVLRDRWVPVLVRHQVGPDVYERYVRDIHKSARTRDASTLLSHAFGLVTELIHPLEAEADTCFVAMPFRRPFVDYFGSYYRPALARAGFRAIRAWGGISSEEYYPFVGTLISRCGAVFAELGSLNLNVINEIGLAHGANRQTFLVMRKQRRDPPSNIAQLPIFQYSDGGSGWQPRDAPRLARFIRWMWNNYVASLVVESTTEGVARELIRYLRIAKRPVSDELLALAGVRPLGVRARRRARSLPDGLAARRSSRAAKLRS